MEKNILNDATFIKHPTQEGVFMKHLFSSADNDRLNNLEVRIVPGYMIEPHVHDNSSEFYYVAEGNVITSYSIHYTKLYEVKH